MSARHGRTAGTRGAQPWTVPGDDGAPYDWLAEPEPSAPWSGSPQPGSPQPRLSTARAAARLPGAPRPLRCGMVRFPCGAGSLRCHLARLSGGAGSLRRGMARLSPYGSPGPSNMGAPLSPFSGAGLPGVVRPFRSRGTLRPIVAGRVDRRRVLHVPRHRSAEQPAAAHGADRARSPAVATAAGLHRRRRGYAGLAGHPLARGHRRAGLVRPRGDDRSPRRAGRHRRLAAGRGLPGHPGGGSTVNVRGPGFPHRLTRTAGQPQSPEAGPYAPGQTSSPAPGAYPSTTPRSPEAAPHTPGPIQPGAYPSGAPQPPEAGPYTPGQTSSPRAGRLFPHRTAIIRGGPLLFGTVHRTDRPVPPARARHAGPDVQARS